MTQKTMNTQWAGVPAESDAVERLSIQYDPQEGFFERGEDGPIRKGNYLAVMRSIKPVKAGTGAKNPDGWMLNVELAVAGPESCGHINRVAWANVSFPVGEIRPDTVPGKANSTTVKVFNTFLRSVFSAMGKDFSTMPAAQVSLEALRKITAPVPINIAPRKPRPGTTSGAGYDVTFITMDAFKKHPGPHADANENQGASGGSSEDFDQGTEPDVPLEGGGDDPFSTGSSTSDAPDESSEPTNAGENTDPFGASADDPFSM